jgi:hypothetical protein
VLTVLLVAAAGLLLVAALAVAVLRFRSPSDFDRVPQSVLTRLNAEYRDLR